MKDHYSSTTAIDKGGVRLGGIKVEDITDTTKPY